MLVPASIENRTSLGRYGINKQTNKQAISSYYNYLCSNDSTLRLSSCSEIGMVRLFLSRISPTGVEACFCLHISVDFTSLPAREEDRTSFSSLSSLVMRLSIRMDTNTMNTMLNIIRQTAVTTKINDDDRRPEEDRTRVSWETILCLKPWISKQLTLQCWFGFRVATLNFSRVLPAMGLKLHSPKQMSSMLPSDVTSWLKWLWRHWSVLTAKWCTWCYRRCLSTLILNWRNYNRVFFSVAKAILCFTIDIIL